MTTDDKDVKGWGRRLDGLIKRVGDEVGGERGEKVRARLTEAKTRVEAGLESDEVRRLRGEVVTLGDKAMDRVDDALRHERTQAVVKRVDAALTEIGDRLGVEHAEAPTSDPPPKASAAATGSGEAAAQTDVAAARPEETAAAADEAAARADEMGAEADEMSARADEMAAEADETAARADELAAEAEETTATRDMATGAGDTTPAISPNSEDETPTKPA